MINPQYEELREVRRGQTGTGLLIERDGHILGNSDAVMQMREDIEHGHKFVCPQPFTVSAIFQKYGVKNANGRIYGKDVLVPAVNAYIEERVDKNCAIGALDHPQSSELSGHDISHNITELHWEGKTLLGTMQLHLSPGYVRYGVCSTSGDLVANMLLDGYLIGVSSRALGTVKEMPGGVLAVDSGLEILCWDVVMSPSTPNAYVSLDKRELSPFIEGEEKKGDTIEEKIASIARVLRG